MLRVRDAQLRGSSEKKVNHVWVVATHGLCQASGQTDSHNRKRTHKLTHSLTHTHEHTNTHTQTNKHTNKHTHANSNPHKHTCYASTQADEHVLAASTTCANESPARERPPRQSCTHTQTHMQHKHAGRRACPSRIHHTCKPITGTLAYHPPPY